MKNNRYTIRVTDPLLRPGLSIETVSSEKYLPSVTLTLLENVRQINLTLDPNHLAPNDVRPVSPPQLWIVGQVRDGKQWEFQGVFSTEKEAVDACVNDRYFVGPAVLGQKFPDLTCSWRDAYWPRVR